MKVAFATSDNVHINSHFGWAKNIDVYDVSPEGYNFLSTVTFDGNLKEDGDEDKLVPKVEAVIDCTLVYVSAIGGGAAARLINKRVTPIKSRSEEDEITQVLEHLVKTLKGNPPPWLRKAIQQDKVTNFVEE
ncbi:nitrogen fixation protein NifX [Oscillatoria sp. FACHB-1406]|uniref:nitrogen fixation protein NifX n=1 Tax=Oscillatoria sp. FACHB-1406 TaxID=2692846 RepID=UPI00168966A9|nr:nitrogen fixation protein NifX [Oscillatoria sp. FACHB-1406]MBD2577793.1 nitrogen fixation protein NifX [Oscillatoria sp. FACHB-1406]